MREVTLLAIAGHLVGHLPAHRAQQGRATLPVGSVRSIGQVGRVHRTMIPDLLTATDQTATDDPCPGSRCSVTSSGAFGSG